MEIRCEGFLLRPYREGDEEALVRHANHRSVWLNLRDRFPHPYTPAAAEQWIAINEAAGEPARNLAIVLEAADGVVGGVGVEIFDDVYHRNGEVGYWLGPEHHGRGIATAALRAFVPYCFERFDLLRLEAGVFAHNAASCRVLEKNGFALEARMRQRIVKQGERFDELHYALLREPS